MTDLRIDSDGDLVVADFDLALATDADALAQRLRIRLRHLLGEWFLDTEFGLPYFDEILVKNPNPVVVDAIFKDAILSTPGVLQLSSFSSRLDRRHRRLELDFRVRTSLGALRFTEVLP